MAVRGILYFVISALLTFVFLFAGANKLTDAIDSKIHAEMITNFQKYGAMIGQTDNFRLFTGALEVGCALLMWVPGFKTIADFLLLATMTGAVGAHVMHNEPWFAPAILGGLIVVRRFLATPATKKKSH